MGKVEQQRLGELGTQVMLENPQSAETPQLPKGQLQEKIEHTKKSSYNKWYKTYEGAN